MARSSNGSGRPVYTTPGWVKIMGVIALVAAAAIVAAIVSGLGGAHGPGRHMPQAESVQAPSQ